MSVYPNRYFIVNKPYNMVSQFVSSDNVRLLGQLNYSFPEGTHAIGRLDNNSEGLLLLTTDKKLTRLLFQDQVPHKRKYLVQVNNLISEESIRKLKEGIVIKIKGGLLYKSSPCEVKLIEKPQDLFSNGLFINENQPSSWVSITLTQGKYHQVRKMIGALKLRVLRLIRVAIENVELGNLQPGEVKEIQEHEIFILLFFAKNDFSQI